MATIVGHRSLTKEGSVKRTLEVEISLEVTLVQFDSLSSVWSSFALCVYVYVPSSSGSKNASYLSHAQHN